MGCKSVASPFPDVRAYLLPTPTQLVVVAFLAATLFLRTRLQPPTLQHGRWYLGFLFYSSYFLAASGWSELSITVRQAVAANEVADHGQRSIVPFVLANMLVQNLNIC